MAASVRERLANRARQTGRSFQELLTYYTLERFLYRLSRSPQADRFVLKGALMFRAWEAPPGRPTRDADFLGRGDPSVDELERVAREVCAIEVEPDGLVFDSGSVVGERIREEADYGGVRVRLLARLGQAQTRVQLDVGFGDIVVPAPVEVEYPTILDFPAPRLRGYTRESAIAEKFEAMVTLGEANTRLKDFYDVWFLARHFDFDGPTLGRAVRATFERRGTELPHSPPALSEAFAEDSARQVQWRAFVRRSGVTDAPDEFGEVASVVRALLAPVAETASTGQSLDRHWRAPGPWA